MMYLYRLFDKKKFIGAYNVAHFFQKFAVSTWASVLEGILQRSELENWHFEEKSENGNNLRTVPPRGKLTFPQIFARAVGIHKAKMEVATPQFFEIINLESRLKCWECWHQHFSEKKGKEISSSFSSTYKKENKF